MGLAQYFLDGRQQLIRIKWFYDPTGCTCTFTLGLFVRSGFGGQHENRCKFKRGLRSKFFDQGNAVHARHIHVAHDEGDVGMLLEPLDPQQAIRRLEDIPTPKFRADAAATMAAA